MKKQVVCALVVAFSAGSMVQGRSKVRSEATGPKKPLTEKTSIFDVIKKGENKKLQEYVSKGVSLNVKSAGGNSPLHVAVLENNVGAVKILLDGGAQVGALNRNKQTPLGLAIQSKEALVRLIGPNYPQNAQKKLNDREEIIRLLQQAQ